MSRQFLPLVLSFFCFFNWGCSSKNETKELRLAIWAHYISSETLKKFEKQHQLRLKISHYASNEELLAKIQLNPNSFDVVVPSDYMVKIMRDQNLLAEINHKEITHLKSIESRFLGLKHDPENKFSVPYAWTSTGIATRTDLVPQPIDSIQDLFEKPELKGQISALDDIRELSAAALRINKKNANSRKVEDVQIAFDYLKKQKSQFKAFNSNAVDLLLNREIKAGLVYSSDALIAQKSDPRIEFRVPKEGASWALDSMVILKSSSRQSEAHQLIQFLTTPENNRDLVLSVRVGPVVKGTKELLPEELQKNPALFPTEETVKRLQMFEDLGSEQKVYEQHWTDFKTL